MKENNKKIWRKKYFMDRVIDMKSYFNQNELDILKKFGIYLEDKLYTVSEYEMEKIKVFFYDIDIKEDDRDWKYRKHLKDINVSKKQCDVILKKFEKIDAQYLYI